MSNPPINSDIAEMERLIELKHKSDETNISYNLDPYEAYEDALDLFFAPGGPASRIAALSTLTPTCAASGMDRAGADSGRTRTENEMTAPITPEQAAGMSDFGEMYRFLGDQNVYCKECFDERVKENADER